MDVCVYGEYTVKRVLTDTSLFGDVPGFGHSETRDDLRAGDFYAYKTTYYDDEGNVIDRGTAVLMAYSVEGDQVTYGWLDEDVTYTSPVSVFADHLQQYDMSTALGTVLMSIDSYGERLCAVFEVQGDIDGLNVVGVDDGVCYAYQQYYDGYSVHFELLYSTMVAGDVGDASVPARDDFVPGDEYCNLVMERVDGQWTTYRSTLIVEEVLDGSQICGYYEDGTYVGSDEVLFTDDTGSEDEVVGETRMLTPWGVLDMTVCQQTLEDGTVFTYCYPQVLDFVLAYMYVYPTGDIYIAVLTENTMFQPSP